MRFLFGGAHGWLDYGAGAVKPLLYILENLARRGHHCRVVMLGPHRRGAVEVSRQQFWDALTAQGISFRRNVQPGVDSLSLNGVEYVAVAEFNLLATTVAEQYRTFNPDRVICGNDEILKIAIQDKPERIFYLIQDTISQPFGPAAFAPDQALADLIKQRVHRSACVAKHLKEYTTKWGGITPTPLPLPLLAMKRGPYPNFGNFNRGLVTLINACDFKGLPILLGLASRFPNLAFGAVVSWGTTREDVETLKGFPNIKIFNQTPNIDEIYSQTRILLAPTLVDEAFGQVAVEARLRGIPVMASRNSGFMESMEGGDYLLPVRPITEVRRPDGSWHVGLPRATVPEQDLNPWEQTLGTLVSDEATYRAASARSRQEAERQLDRAHETRFDAVEQLLL